MDIAEFLNTVDSLVWGPVMICLLLGTHIVITIRTGCVQRMLPKAIKMSFVADDDAEGDVSNFGALATALASTIGTGSIIGVATAVIAGGPGAVFWMWITGVFGMATKYAEVYASVRYRVKDANGEMMGGAMYIWERAFVRPDGTVPTFAKIMAASFAAFAIIATIGTGSAVQSSAITTVICANMPAPAWLVGAIVTVCVALVIFGGVKTIARVCEKLVPVMALAYSLGCVVILVFNAPYLGEAIMTILECAFTGKAVFGGAVGSGLLCALQFGCARGLFSNESGLGSAPIVAAAAATKNPARQALIAMTGTFWSTVVICLITGLVLVSTMIAHPDIVTEATVAEGANLASAAFGTIPFIGRPILVFGMVSFAYSTIIGWSYYGNRCATYLFGHLGASIYRVVYVAVGFLGAIGVGSLVWTISDIGNALMAIPNIIAILALGGKLAKDTKYYLYEGHLDERFDEEIPTVQR